MGVGVGVGLGGGLDAAAAKALGGPDGAALPLHAMLRRVRSRASQHALFLVLLCHRAGQKERERERERERGGERGEGRGRGLARRNEPPVDFAALAERALQGDFPSRLALALGAGAGKGEREGKGEGKGEGEGEGGREAVEALCAELLGHGAAGTPL